MREAWNKAYDVNVTGANVVTHTFAPLLLKSAAPRLLFLASGMSSLTKMSEAHYPVPGPIPAGWPKKAGYLPSAYRASKTALTMAMLSWFWVLKEDGVRVWSVEPGFLATGLGGQRAAASRSKAGDPASGGKLVSSVIEGEKDDLVGKVVNQTGVLPY
jgi:NAD(P)-dependent dehydrogenase (short-subunit alcohol dehydrogenase family)